MLATGRDSPAIVRKSALVLLVAGALVLHAVLGTIGLGVTSAAASVADDDICRAGAIHDSGGRPAAPAHHAGDPCCALACGTNGLTGCALLPRIIAAVLVPVSRTVEPPVPADRSVSGPLGPPARPLGSRAPPSTLV